MTSDVIPRSILARSPGMSANRRRFLGLGLASLVGSLVGPLLKGCASGDRASSLKGPPPSGPPLRLGAVFSLTGAWAARESPIADGLMLAALTANLEGGLFGRPIEVRIKDAKSDPEGYRRQAVNLIENDKTLSIVGGGNQEARKAMAGVLEQRQGLLWYPLAYEGNECLSSVLYLGAVPNQTVEPAIDGLFPISSGDTRPQGQPTAAETEPTPTATAQESAESETTGINPELLSPRSLFVLAYDDAYGRLALELAATKLGQLGGQLAGQALVMPGLSDVQGPIAALKSALPNGGPVLCLLAAADGLAWLKALRAAKLAGTLYPTVLIDPITGDLGPIDLAVSAGHLWGGNYLSELPNPVNQRFAELYRSQYGAARSPSTAAATAYTALLIWRSAVEKAGVADDRDKLLAAAYGLAVDSPLGAVRLLSNHHLAQPFYLARPTSDRPSTQTPEPKSSASDESIGNLSLVTAKPVAIDPQPWNPLTETGRGFACDWSDPNKGGKYKLNSRPAAESTNRPTPEPSASTSPEPTRSQTL